MKKFKFILIALASSWALISLSFPVFAVDVIKSPIDPAYEVLNNNYRVRYVYYLNGDSSIGEAYTKAGYYICDLLIEVPDGYSVRVGQPSYNAVRAYIYDSSGNLAPAGLNHYQTRTIYNAKTGGLIYQRARWRTNVTTIAVGPLDTFPVSSGESSLLGGKYFAGNGAQVSTSLSVVSGSFDSPFVKLGYGNGYGYETTLPEPFPTDHNAFAWMTLPRSQNKSFFYSFYIENFSLAQTEMTGINDGHVIDFTFSDVSILEFASTATDISHWRFILRVPSYPVQTDLAQVYCDLKILITKFDGYTGDFIDSRLIEYHDNIPYYGVSLWTDTDGFFPDFGQLSAAAFYGLTIYYYASGNQGLNYANVRWSYDLKAENWRNRMESICNNILRVLQNADVDIDPVTKPQDLIDGLRDAEDALTPTYQDGTPIDVVGEVDQAFQVGENALGDVQSARSSFNYQINKFLSLSPLLVIPIVVALSIGLVITILGKNKS